MPRRLTPAIQAALLVVVVSYLSSGAGAQAGVPARPGPDGQRSPGLRPQPGGEARPGPDHRPPHDPPGTPGPLAGGVGREGQPADTQSDADLGPGGTARQTERRALHPVRAGHRVRHPPGPGPTVHHHGRMEHGGRHRQSRSTPAPGTPHPHLAAPDRPCRRHHLVPVRVGR